MTHSVLLELQAIPGQDPAFSLSIENSVFIIDENYQPVRMRGSQAIRPNAAGLGGLPEGDEFRETLVVRADIEENQEERVLDQPGVLAVWSDPEIAPIGIDCDFHQAKGDTNDVARNLGADFIWQDAGTRGEGIRIGILDGGVDRNKFPVIGGWSPDPASPPGSGNVVWGEHGNMCATDTLIACPDAKILDYAIGRTRGVPALLSSALQSYQHALNMIEVDGPYPHIMSNSWGLYQQSWDPYPPGHPSNYTHNINHPLNRIIINYIELGNLVTFAAGNCGQVCPDNRCGVDSGPGNSIRGANGLERVICVGAVNINDEWIGYSSQGPSTFALEKPDVCSYSHFNGYFSPDSGTSAACPVVAGVLGILRASCSPFDQDRARWVLQKTARQRASSQWSSDFGFGIVDAKGAYLMLK